MVSLSMRTLCIISTLSFTSLYGSDSPIRTGRMTAMRLAAKNSVSTEEESSDESRYIGRLLMEATVLISSNPSDRATLLQHALFFKLEKCTGVVSPSKPKCLTMPLSASIKDLETLKKMPLSEIGKILEELKGSNA